MTKEMNRLNWIRPLLRKMNGRMRVNYNKITPMAKMMLLLTTRGRKSGLARTTPLQYEYVEGAYILAAGWGEKSDWLRNVEADPQVEIQVGTKHLKGTAEIVRDPGRIADLLELKRKTKPLIGFVMHLEGLPLGYTRADLEKFAASKVMVIVHPV